MKTVEIKPSVFVKFEDIKNELHDGDVILILRGEGVEVTTVMKDINGWSYLRRRRWIQDSDLWRRIEDENDPYEQGYIPPERTVVYTVANEWAPLFGHETVALLRCFTKLAIPTAGELKISREVYLEYDCTEEAVVKDAVSYPSLPSKEDIIGEADML